MRPFRYIVIILNTIDHLGKFIGKADEGFFVGYSTNSKAFRVFNSRNGRVENNLYVQFSENTSNITRSGPNWLFDMHALTNSMNYKPVVAENQSNGNAGTKACNDVGKDSEVPSTKEPREDQRVNQELNVSINSTNNINTASDGNNTNNVNAISSTVNAVVTKVNVVDPKTSIELPNDPNMSELEDIVYSDDDEDIGAKANMNNLDAFMPVCLILTIRIHKDHPVEQIIRDLNSTPQTRRMTKNLKEHGLFSSVQQRTNHKDFQNCLFACFLSQEGTRKIESAFLYGKIEEEVYVCQPPEFEDPYLPDRKSLCTDFENKMHTKFQMSSMGELTFFLGLQVKQKEDGIFISQDKYVTEILKKFSFSDVKTSSTPMETHKPLLKYADGEDIDEHMKSTTGGIGVNAGNSKLMLLGINLLLLWKVNAARHNLLLLDATAKVKTVNGEVQLQALVDGKKIIITKTSVRRDLQLKDAEGIACLPNADIYEQIALMGAKSTAWNKFSSTMASAIIYLAIIQNFNFSKYIFESMVKNMDSSVKFLIYTLPHQEGFGSMKREGKCFSGRVTSLFPTMMVQAQEEIGPIADEASNEENVPTQSNDPPLSRVNTFRSGEDRLKLKELMDLYTKQSDRVLDLETTKTTQAKEIASLKKRVKKLEKKRKSKTPRMKRIFPRLVRSAQVISSEDKGLGDQEDASKQGRKIDNIDKDAEVTLVDETQGRPDKELALKLQAEEEEQHACKEKAEKVKSNISWDNVQAMIEADRLLAKRLQAREQEELTNEEKARLFIELLKKIKKHFTALRAQEKRKKPPTKAQKKSIMSTYLKHMADDDQEEAEMKKLIKVVPDEEEVAIDAIPLATKPLSIVDCKIVKEGKINLFQIIRANGSSKRYSSMI
ncbi:putative ribonuclease H-like domain-containing protein [Tanacetum coccineum]